MTRARIAWTAMTVGSVLTACVGNAGNTDPCGGAPTCVVIDVESPVIHTIDQLTLDLVYNGIHGTAVTGVAGDARSLPLTTAVILDVPGSPLIDLELLAAGKLGGSVLGADARSITIQPGNHESTFLELFPVGPCAEGELYCGGVGSIFADGASLYRCTAGFLQFYTRCSHGCVFHDQPGAVCVGDGLCRDGGTYCGGDQLDGDPGTLYVCHQFEATAPTRCSAGCVVRGDGNDACQ
jgi:hypothetical protein